MTSTVTSVVGRHVLPKFGQTRVVDLDKLELQKHLNALAESFSRSMVKKILVQYRAILEEAVERELVDLPGGLAQDGTVSRLGWISMLASASTRRSMT